MKLFVDTSAFIALENSSDRHHGSAGDFYRTLKGVDRLITSNYVVDETATRLRFTIGWKGALAFLETLFLSRLFRLVYVDEELEQEAVRVFKRFHDQKLSFTDCVSIAVVRRDKLDGVFGFDDDFPAAGIALFPHGAAH